MFPALSLQWRKKNVTIMCVYVCTSVKALEIVCGKITLRKSITFSFLFIFSLFLSDFLLMFFCVFPSHPLTHSLKAVCFLWWRYNSRLHTYFSCNGYGKCKAKEVENEWGEKTYDIIWVVGWYWVVVDVVVAAMKRVRYCGWNWKENLSLYKEATRSQEEGVISLTLQPSLKRKFIMKN